MKAIVGFEESQAVTIALRNRGMEAYSCDLQDCSGGYPEWHIKGDIYEVIPRHIHTLDFLGLHPVCRLLANSGVRWLASKTPKPGYDWSERFKIYMNEERYTEMVRAAQVLKQCIQWVQEVGCGYVENPIIHKYAIDVIGVKPSQVIQPWMFGNTTKKATMLWLVNLPNLRPTKIVPKHLRTDEIHKCPPGPERAKLRSKTFPGIAEAIADQFTRPYIDLFHAA